MREPEPARGTPSKGAPSRGAQSNPTRRVVLVLDFLARHRHRSFSLSELARELDISKSTLHGIVETLLEAGYLLRDPGSLHYRLGPALAGVGQAALGPHGPLVDALRPVMDRLAREFEAHCVVSADLGGFIVPLALAGEPARVTTLCRVGERLPLSPPMGTLFMAGRQMSEIRAWLDRARPPLSAAEVELHLSAVDLLRSNGFAAAARVDAKARLERALGVLEFGDPKDQGVVDHLMGELRRARYLLLDFEDPAPIEVDWIGVPVIGRQARTELALVVLNLPAPLSGPRIAEVAGHLRSAVAVQ
ncbi:Transcriptional regulator, IclR family [Frankia canadensis]|uniref:Transcriptional regulator, IclR family n=1 Tax=Frankia canadensis TaxID=1836972 RepID=A0A2I2KPK4_9ACTN|nr:helix-turn-helix domain-containing protein [Frankia canadensis]SNQ47594.1 Transcriptional regulator, IclR family [Frankia canadensis]SOU54884.1 Transcriptional regulator, IclR family [Frankia canadensis]